MGFQSFRSWPRHASGALSAALLLVSACGQKPATAPSSGPTTQQSSDSSASERVSLTVYNKNFGLVREVRNVHLGTGTVELTYADVSAHIQPETVHLKSLTAANQLSILEQNYRYDLLSPDTLLKKYVGQAIKVYRYNEHTGAEEEKQAELLSVEGGTVLKIDDQITSNFAGRYAFPKVPENLVQKPSLVWLLTSAAAEQQVEVTYLTQGLDWHADYVLTIDADDKLGDLMGWVTLKNETGTSYRNAQLKLVAGDVQRVAPEAPKMDQSRLVAPAAAPAASQFKEEGLFEYHLYTLERPTSLLDKERKQVSLLSASNIALEKKLIFFGEQNFYRVRLGDQVNNQKVGVYLDLQNQEKNHLGVPLPKGTLRVYKSDQAGQKQFIGEDAIDHTPRDERIRVKLGEAFDIVAERRQTAWRAFGNCANESEWEIKLRNHKDTPQTVEVNEPAFGDWAILFSSIPASKKDSKTFSFDVQLAPRSETKLIYGLRVSWC